MFAKIGICVMAIQTDREKFFREVFQDGKNGCITVPLMKLSVFSSRLAFLLLVSSEFAFSYGLFFFYVWSPFPSAVLDGNHCRLGTGAHVVAVFGWHRCHMRLVNQYIIMFWSHFQFVGSLLLVINDSLKSRALDVSSGLRGRRTRNSVVFASVNDAGPYLRGAMGECVPPWHLDFQCSAECTNSTTIFIYSIKCIITISIIKNVLISQ